VLLETGLSVTQCKARMGHVSSSSFHVYVDRLQHTRQQQEDQAEIEHALAQSTEVRGSSGASAPSHVSSDLGYEEIRGDVVDTVRAYRHSVSSHASSRALVRDSGVTGDLIDTMGTSSTSPVRSSAVNDTVVDTMGTSSSSTITDVVDTMGSGIMATTSSSDHSWALGVSQGYYL
jgi:hypothetical protein